MPVNSKVSSSNSFVCSHGSLVSSYLIYYYKSSEPWVNTRWILLKRTMTRWKTHAKAVLNSQFLLFSFFWLCSRHLIHSLDIHSCGGHNPKRKKENVGTDCDVLFHKFICLTFPYLPHLQSKVKHLMNLYWRGQSGISLIILLYCPILCKFL